MGGRQGVNPDSAQRSPATLMGNTLGGSPSPAQRSSWGQVKARYARAPARRQRRRTTARQSPRRSSDADRCTRDTRKHAGQAPREWKLSSGNRFSWKAVLFATTRERHGPWPEHAWPDRCESQNETYETRRCAPPSIARQPDRNSDTRTLNPWPPRVSGALPHARESLRMG